MQVAGLGHGEIFPMDPVRRRKATYQDYLQWPDDQRWEIIDGEPYAMSSPGTVHQGLCMELGAFLHAAFKSSPCRVFTAPLDVKLSDFDVVQPDILIVCDREQIKPTHIEGPPELVIEILSPTTTRHDRVRKFRLYAAAGVAEYWQVSPIPAMVEVHQWDQGGYRTHGVFTEQDTLTSAAFPHLSIVLSNIFPEQEIDEVRESPIPYAITASQTGTREPS